MQHLWRIAALSLSLAGTCGALPASAGAWPREEGEVFLSLGYNVALFSAVRPVHYDPTIYAEWGATPRITLGFDAHTGDAGEVASAFAFLRLPLDQGEGRDRWAMSFALGYTLTPEGGEEAEGRYGLHWGRGIENGWLAFDATVQRDLDGGPPRTKFDMTVGQTLPWGEDDPWTATVQLFSGTGFDGDFYAKISPGISYAVTDGIALRAGVVHALTGDRGSALSVEAWFTF